jgi:hypothetical protein
MNGDGASMKGSSEESKRLDLDRTREEDTTDESRIIRKARLSKYVTFAMLSQKLLPRTLFCNRN